MLDLIDISVTCILTISSWLELDFQFSLPTPIDRITISKISNSSVTRHELYNQRKHVNKNTKKKRNGLMHVCTGKPRRGTFHNEQHGALSADYERDACQQTKVCTLCGREHTCMMYHACS